MVQQQRWSCVAAAGRNLMKPPYSRPPRLCACADLAAGAASSTTRQNNKFKDVTQKQQQLHCAALSASSKAHKAHSGVVKPSNSRSLRLCVGADLAAGAASSTTRQNNKFKAVTHKQQQLHCAALSASSKAHKAHSGVVTERARPRPVRPIVRKRTKKFVIWV